MAAPWLALLKNVPWMEVVRNASVVAESARKLWNSVSRQPPAGQAPAATAGAATERALLADTQGLAGIQARVAVMERQLSELHDEMVATSGLIKSLAEQNTQLVARIEANRARTVWLVVTTTVFGLIAVAALAVALAR